VWRVGHVHQICGSLEENGQKIAQQGTTKADPKRPKTERKLRSEWRQTENPKRKKTNMKPKIYRKSGTQENNVKRRFEENKEKKPYSVFTGGVTLPD
jgi:hypothetical protein